MKTYRLKRDFQRIAIGLLVPMAVLLVGSLILTYFTAPAGHFIDRACLVLIVGGGLMGVPAYMLADYARHRLELDGQRVKVTGLFSRHEANLTEVTDAQWQVGGTGDGLRLRTSAGDMVIPLGSYAPDARQEISASLRAALPVDRQQGWDHFCYEVLVPADPKRDVLSLEENRELVRRRIERLIAGPAVIAGLVSLIGWSITKDPRWILGASAVLLLAIMIEFFLGPSDPALRRWLSSPRRKWLYAGFFVWAAVMLAIGCLAAFFPVLHAPVTVLSAVSAFIMLWLLLRIQREHRQSLEPIEHAAAAEWERAHHAIVGH